MGNSSQVFFVSLVVLLLVLTVLVILYLILKYRKNRNLTVLKVTATQPTRVLTISTEPVHAQQILDHLLDRVFLKTERRPQAGESCDSGAEPSEERGSDSESYQATRPVLMLSRVTTLRDKLSRWTTVMVPPKASSLSFSPTPPPPTNQDQPEDLDSQQSSEYERASCSSDRK